MRARSAQLRRRAAGARSTSGSRCGAAPASRRADCPRAARSRSRASGGAPATKPRWKSSGCARWSALRGADVERDVADQAHAARGRVAPQRAPLALEAHLIRGGAGAGEALPVGDPVGVRGAEGRELARRSRPRSGSASRPGQPAKAERRGVRRARAVGRAERQHLPPRLPGGGEPVDEAVGRRTQPSRPEET